MIRDWAILPLVGMALAGIGCWRRPVRLPSSADAAAYVVRIISAHGLAHGCPTSRWTMLTARHVAVRESAYDGHVEPLTALWGDAQGHVGSAWTTAYDSRRDLAMMRSAEPFPAYHLPAGEAPRINDMLVVTGFGFGLAPRRARLLEVFAAHLVLDIPAEPGRSGACVLDSDGALVGIAQWGVTYDGRGVLVAVGVWGDWRMVPG